MFNFLSKHPQDTKTNVYKELEKVLSLLPDIPSNQKLSSIKSNWPKFTSEDFLNHLKSLITNGKVNYWSLYILFVGSLFVLEDKLKDSTKELFEILSQKPNFSLGDFDTKLADFSKLLKAYIEVKDEQLLDLEKENKELKQKIEDLQRRLNIFVKLISNFYYKFAELNKNNPEINTLSDFIDTFKLIEKENKKMERFILYLKEKGILVSTSSGGLRLNPNIKHENKSKIIVPDNSKELSLDKSLSAVIKPSSDKLHKVQEYDFHPFDETNSHKQDEADLKEKEKSKEDILPDVFGDILMELEKEKEEKEKLKEELAKLKKENKELKRELESLKNEQLQDKNKNSNHNPYDTNFSITA